MMMIDVDHDHGQGCSDDRSTMMMVLVGRMMIGHDTGDDTLLSIVYKTNPCNVLIFNRRSVVYNRRCRSMDKGMHNSSIARKPHNHHDAYETTSTNSSSSLEGRAECRKRRCCG